MWLWVLCWKYGKSTFLPLKRRMFRSMSQNYLASLCNPQKVVYFYTMCVIQFAKFTQKIRNSVWTETLGHEFSNCFSIYIKYYHHYLINTLFKSTHFQQVCQVLRKTLKSCRWFSFYIQEFQNFLRTHLKKKKVHFLDSFRRLIKISLHGAYFPGAYFLWCSN